jgi:hypothetical protein
MVQSAKCVVGVKSRSDTPGEATYHLLMRRWTVGLAALPPRWSFRLRLREVVHRAGAPSRQLRRCPSGVRSTGRKRRSA